MNLNKLTKVELINKIDQLKKEILEADLLELQSTGGSSSLH
jgi:hypothetical protein